MFMLNNAPLPIDTPFEINGTHYPSNWLRLTSIEEKNAVGITEVPDPEPYDDRFFWGHDNPKDLDMLKKQWTQWADDTAWQLLQRTDWMDSRKANDPSFTPDPVWLTWRESIRSEAKAAKTAIAGATDVESLKTAIAVQWSPDPNAPKLGV